MTVYIPTGDLVGIIGDVAHLANPEKEVPATHAVRIEYDGECVHASATDSTRAGISTWHPDDISDEATQEGLFAPRGGDDEPWSVVLSLPDALDVVKKFKLPDKLRWVSLGLDYVEGTTGPHRLRITRGTDSGLTGLSMVLLDQDVEFPDVRGFLDSVPAPKPMPEFLVNGELLSSFGQVRQRGGGMKITLTGAGSVALVTIGRRFRGGLVTIREARRLAPAA